MANEYASTKLVVEVKNRLLARVGKLSISDYIDQMLTFFDVSGARPSDFQTHPTIQLKKDIDRSIAVTRGAEVNILKKLDKLDTLIEMLQTKTEQEGFPTAASVPAAGEGEEGAVTSEMIQQVVAENERLAAQLQQSKERERLLQAEVDKLKSTPATAQTGNGSIKEALDLFAWLKGSMKKNTFNDDYSISAPGWRGFQERFEKLK